MFSCLGNYTSYSDPREKQWFQFDRDQNLTQEQAERFPEIEGSGREKCKDHQRFSNNKQEPKGTWKIRCAEKGKGGTILRQEMVKYR